MAVPSGMMRIKLKASIIIADYPGKQVGDIFDLPASLGYHLITNRWAEQIIPSESPPEVIETREPEVQNRDPQPAVPPQTPPGKSLPRKLAK